MRTSGAVAVLILGLIGTPRVGFAQAPGAVPSTVTSTPKATRSSTTSRALSEGLTLAELRREIKDLKALSEGGMPDGVVVQDLFEVDLLDESAIEGRVVQLRRDLAATSTTGVSPIRAARTQRDRLRLGLLSRSPEARARLVAAELQRRRLIDEKQAADNSLREAQAREAQAEAARVQALEAARQAHTAAERSLANERARFEASRSLLAQAEGELAGRRQSTAASLQAELEHLGELEGQVHEPTLSPSVADELYDRVVAQLSVRREDLSRALDQLSELGETNHFEPQLDLSAADLDAFSEGRNLLQQEIEQHLKAEDALQRLQHDFLVSTANEVGTQVIRLNKLRLDLRPDLSADKLSRLTSLTREGIAQLQRELEHLFLLSRWYFRARLARLFSFETVFGDLLAVGLASWTALKVLAVVGLALYARRRRETWFAFLRRVLIARSKSRNLTFWIDRWLVAAEALSRELFLLAGVYFVFKVLLAEAGVPEFELIGNLLLAFAVYRFVLAAMHRSVTSAAEARSIKISPELSDRILRSMRLISSYAFAVYIYLTLSETLLGRGNLHGIAASFAWIGVIPIGAVLVARWRGSIVQSYLATHPEGSLSRFVSSTRDRPIGFFAALVAFVFVAARGVFVYASETALGFDNTRRALAYVFRRRLEKQAEASGRRTTNLELLPHRLVVACSDEESRAEALLDHFPELETTLVAARAWRRGAPGRSIALTGEVGIGKTTWLNRFLKDLGGEVTSRTFTHRVIGDADVMEEVSTALGFDTLHDRESLVAALRDAPPRLIIFQHCELLFLRSIGGLSGYEALVEVASRTNDRHFWIISHSERPWSFLTKALRGANRFDTVIDLDPWSEEQITELIEARMKLAGITPVFDDLVIEKLDGTTFDREVIRSGERFTRLVWDYADGNPRIALHFWLRSLDSDGEARARVHLFDGPSADHLEHLEGATRFVLAALVVHESLTAEETAVALAFTVAQSDAALRFLHRSQIVHEVEGRYRVSTHWDRAVGRYLKRKGLIIA